MMSDSGPAPSFVALETEQMVLGSCLEWQGLTEQFVAAGLRERHFFRAAHRVLWRRLVEAGRTEELDEAARERARSGLVRLVVHMLLAKHGELDEVSPAYMSTLIQLGGLPVRPEGVYTLTQRLTECAVGRDVLGSLRRAVQQLEAKPETLAEGFFAGVAGSLQALAGQLAGRRIPEHVAHISQVMEEVKAALLAGPPAFVDTPWPALNAMLGGGFAPGELIFLGARPGLGKTAAALDIAGRAAKRGSPVFIVSREMLTVAMGMRLVAQEGPVHATSLRRRDLSPFHWRTIENALEVLVTLPLFMTHAALDVDEIRRIVGLLCAEGSLGLVVVDYLQLIDAPKGVTERRHQVEAVSKGLKAITLDFGVPVLCLSSLSRPPEGKRPTLASLRESGNLEHDADTVILLHREDEMEPKTDVVVAKSRNGRTGMVELYFRGEHFRFEEQVS